MKKCNKCGRELDESMFYKTKKSKDGLASDCKDCRKAYMKTYKPPKKEIIEQNKKPIEKVIKQRICVVCGKSFIPKINENGKVSESNFCSEACIDKKYHTKVCSCCGKEFIVPKINGKYSTNTRICAECKNKPKVIKPKEKTCLCCGKRFLQNILPNGRLSKSAFCSELCYKNSVYIRQPSKCLNCNKDILEYTKQGYLIKRKFCSRDCMLNYFKQHPKKYSKQIKYCKICGNNIPENRKASIYCSDLCARKAEFKRAKKMYCKFCGKEILLYDDNYNRLFYGEKSYCSQECYKNSLKEKYYDKYNNLVCEYCGKTYSLFDNQYYHKLSNSIYRGTNYYHYCSKECADLAREQKKQQTCLAKYGVDNISKVRTIREKAEETMLAKYGVKYSCQLPQAIETNSHTISKINKEFLEILCNNLGYIKNKNVFLEFVVGDYNYDIGIPDKHIVIDINPTYTHSILPSHWDIAAGQNFGRDLPYHISRTNMANKNNYRCIHIWQWDDWGLLLELLKPKTKLYARKLQLKEITKQDANNFINRYHLQGSCRGNSVNLGLYQNDELIQIMTFGKPRYNKNYEWELLRLCTCSDYYVVGGAERLFKYFVKTQNPNSIISYCDVSKFTGDVYERLGFKLKEQTKPQKIWSKEHEYITDNLLRQRGADQLIGTHNGKGTDNEEIMIREGWRPVYDCGQKVFIFSII